MINVALLTKQQVKLDLYSIVWSNSVSFESLYSQEQDAMILVKCRLGEVIALRFNNISERYFENLRQDFVSAFVSAYKDRMQTIKECNALDFIPVKRVPSLPMCKMWGGCTRWHEDAIWASEFLRLSVRPIKGEQTSAIELITKDGEIIGTYRVSTDVESDVMRSMVMSLWHALRITESFRVNTNWQGTTAFHFPKPEERIYKGREENMQYFVAYKNKSKEERRLLIHAPNSSVVVRYVWATDPQSIGCQINIQNCLATIDCNIPVIKIEEARWKNKGFGEFYCSLCQGESETKSEFCPHCFAYME